MNDHLENVTRALSATVIHSSTSFSFLGQLSTQLSPRIRRAMTPETARSYLLYQLQSWLYNDFYIRGSLAPSTWGMTALETDPASFVERLSAANCGTGCHESGLEVVSADLGEIVVRRGGLKIWVQPNDCIVEGGASPQAGDRVGLRLPKELRNISSGYYMALSNRGATAESSSEIVRVYWNLRADGAEHFLRIFTRLLSEAKVYFQLKVLNHPSSYIRCDAGVLYFFKADRDVVAKILSDAYPELVSHLKSAVPMFTRFLAPGVGLAEDPGNNESFGQHRCRILAQGMVRAHEIGARSLARRLAITAESFASARICIDSPHLSPGSNDDYASWKLGAA